MRRVEFVVHLHLFVQPFHLQERAFDIVRCEHVAAIQQALQQEGYLGKAAAHMVRGQIVVLLVMPVPAVLLFLLQRLLILVEVGEHAVFKVDVLAVETVQVLAVANQEERDMVRAVHNLILPPVVAVFLVRAARLDGHHTLGVGQQYFVVAALGQPLVERLYLLPVELLVHEQHRLPDDYRLRLGRRLAALQGDDFLLDARVGLDGLNHVVQPFDFAPHLFHNAVHLVNLLFKLVHHLCLHHVAVVLHQHHRPLRLVYLLSQGDERLLVAECHQ